MSAYNPFFQPPKQWQIRIFTSQDYICEISDAFEDIAVATLNFELVEDSEIWCVDIITHALPDKGDIETRLLLFASLYHLPPIKFEIALLEPKDWLAEVEKSFKPLAIGRFYVYGSHVKEKPPHGKLALKINAGAAFGSGEHATTSGCLLALSELAKQRRFRNPVDMGCGSGILALAMVLLWKNRTIGIDIDPVSVVVSRQNARNNRIQKQSIFAAGNGWNSNVVRKYAKYDLIVANILARPLVKMAKELKQHLSPNGIVILSGLLASQERLVLYAHQQQGLRLIKRFSCNGWNTLVLGI